MNLLAFDEMQAQTLPVGLGLWLIVGVLLPVAPAEPVELAVDGGVALACGLPLGLAPTPNVFVLLAVRPAEAVTVGVGVGRGAYGSSAATKAR